MLTICIAVTLCRIIFKPVDYYEGNETIPSYFSHLGEPIQINLYSVSNEVIDDNLETTENLLDVFSSNKWNNTNFKMF